MFVVSEMYRMKMSKPNKIRNTKKGYDNSARKKKRMKWNSGKNVCVFTYTVLNIAFSERKQSREKRTSKLSNKMKAEHLHTHAIYNWQFGF